MVFEAEKPPKAPRKSGRSTSPRAVELRRYVPSNSICIFGLTSSSARLYIDQTDETTGSKTEYHREITVWTYIPIALHLLELSTNLFHSEQAEGFEREFKASAELRKKPRLTPQRQRPATKVTESIRTGTCTTRIGKHIRKLFLRTCP
jgi:hypothetical protein